MELTQMQYFALVAEHGTTAKAAIEARVSQSTVSKSLLRLERELGVELFERQGIHLVLNGAGREFFQQVRPILTAVRRLPEVVQTKKQRRRRYRINVSAAAETMPGLVHYLLAEEPDCEVIISGEAWIGDCDLSITASPSGRSSDSIRLLEEEIFLAVPAALTEPGQEELELLELSRFRVLLPPEGSGLRGILDRALRDIPGAPEAGVTASDNETLRKLVLMGDGVTFWPEKTWQRPDPQKVRLLRLAGIPLKREIYALLPPERKGLEGDLLRRVIEFFKTLE